MEENKNSDFKNKINSGEKSNPRLGLSNLRPGASNSNPRPGPSCSNSRPSSNNHWQDKDRKLSTKRSQTENEDFIRENKVNKRDTPDKVKKEGDSENESTENPNENSSDISLMNFQDITLVSQRMSVTSMPQQQMTVTIPQQSQQQIMHQQAIPYQSYGYNASESYHMDPNQGAYAVNAYSSLMPINSQWPVSNAMPITVNTVSSTSGLGMSNGMELVSPANGNMNAYPYMNMANNDGSLYGMMPTMPGIPVYSPYTLVNNIDAIVPMFNNLEPITIPHAVLTPPLPGERRSRRQKPPGCRTVFVGNLPEKITEEIIRDAFKICGPISVVRMSKKNFCHIRFASMECVDQALLLSGFRIKIDESEDPAFNSRLHVDYAVARDDQHDHECNERTRMREERHRQQDSIHPPSPPAITHFSDSEASTLAERLRNEETFREGLQVLITWLDRGECNKKNSGSFYSLIQSSHSHVKRLRNEKIRCEEEAEKAKENLMNKNRAIELEINEIVKVFLAVKTQKVWDNFTRSQRKKMEEMKNDTYDLKKTNSDDLVVERVEEEMELSDAEDRNGNEDNQWMDPTDEVTVLREKCNNLTEELDGAHQEIQDLKSNCAEHEDEILKLKYELDEFKKLEKTCNDSPISFEDQVSLNDNATQCSPSRVDVTENDNQLISLISIFLHVHPFGASIDYICSYLVKIIIFVNARDIESLLRRHPNLFKEVCTGIGATLEKKWTYIGFRYSN